MARSTRIPFKRSILGTAAALGVGAASPGWAQQGAAPPAAAASAAELAPVTVTGRAAPLASVAGWGDIPLARTPVQATVLQAAQLRDAGATRLADVIALDAGVSDAYNAEGYYDYLTVRGFVLDNRFNYRRDGLPINAETAIPLDNKSGVQILKGTSGLQAGTSAPGGLSTSASSGRPTHPCARRSSSGGNPAASPPRST